MRFRRNVWGFGHRLQPAFVVFAFSATAYAQTEPEGEAPATEEASADPAATPDESAAENDEQPQEKEPPVAPGDAPEAKDKAVKADAEEVLSVRILPGSAFPEPKVRGIVGGSLWLTMHGLQWPYQPKVEGQSGVQFGVSGSAWVDTAYTSISSNNDTNDPDRKRWTNQGRAVLRATPAYSTDGGWFVQGQMEFVAQGDQTVVGGQMGAVDDLYVRAGKWGLFDITAGRFQGWEIYHYGMGLDLNTFERRGAEPAQGAPPPPAVYGVDFFWDRPNSGGGNYAAHFYATDYLRFEALGRFGTSGGSNQFGFRPAAVLDLGFLKAKAGFEWGTSKAQTEIRKEKLEQNGFGGAVQFILNPHVEGGLNFGRGFVDSTNVEGLLDERGSSTTTSFGGFINGRPFGSLLIGLGGNITTREPLELNKVATSPNFGKSNKYTHFLGFVAVQYSFWDRLFLKAVVSKASYSIDDNLQDPPHDLDYDSLGGRLRVMYIF